LQVEEMAVLDEIRDATQRCFVAIAAIELEKQKKKYREEIEAKEQEIVRLRQVNSELEKYREEMDTKEQEIVRLRQVNSELEKYREEMDTKEQEIVRLRQVNSELEKYRKEMDTKEQEIVRLGQVISEMTKLHGVDSGYPEALAVSMSSTRDPLAVQQNQDQMSLDELEAFESLVARTGAVNSLGEECQRLEIESCNCRLHPCNTFKDCMHMFVCLMPCMHP
jgi:chromosome segregation ATPase